MELRIFVCCSYQWVLNVLYMVNTRGKHPHISNEWMLENSLPLTKEAYFGFFFLCHLFFYFLIFMFLNEGCICLSSGFIYIKHEVFVTRIILKSLNKTLKNQLQSAFPIHRFHICRLNQPWIQNIQGKVLIIADMCYVFRPVMVCPYWTCTDFFFLVVIP